MKPEQMLSSDALESHRLRLGIIGCGYVTAMSHLPASVLVDTLRVTALVDANLSLAQQLGRQYQVPLCTTDYSDLFGKVDAVIVALPHHLHRQVTVDFLSHGVHVLVEKPMALSVRECEQMISAADKSKTQLAVGHMRRYYDSSRLVKRIIDSRMLGEVLLFHAEESVNFDSFKASSFTVLPPSGGVLFDTGPHLLDLVLWWFGDLETVAYWDDVVEGVEANCKIEFRTSQGVPGVCELSRTRLLKNKICIEFQEGSLEIATQNPYEVWLHSHLFSGTVTMANLSIAPSEKKSLIPCFAQQLDNFARAILGDQHLEVSGREGKRSITIIERCKQNRQPLPIMPWAQLDKRVTDRVDKICYTA